ncbi:hypothetical protein SynA1825c_02486 [Synechococcus sp. A18-25c]|nr:hypothetical protein SynA1825c_02486 [Synechococcus sp. A18-25c]
MIVPAIGGKGQEDSQQHPSPRSSGRMLNKRRRTAMARIRHLQTGGWCHPSRQS